jgi:NitT/TauT family transport system substrate-binding protein
VKSIFAGVVVAALWSQPSLAQAYRLAASWSFEASQLGLLVAKDRGMFRDNAVDLSLERGFGAADTLRRLIAGDIQFGYVDAMVLIKARAEDPSLDLIMVSNTLQQSPFSVIYIKNKNIKSIEDVEKGKFGDTGGSVAQLFPAFMSAALKTPRSALTYQRITLDPSLRMSALFRGDVDVVATMIFESPVIRYRAKEAGLDIGELEFAQYGFNPYTYGIVVRREFAEKNPAVVKAVVKASLQGWAWACSNPDGATKILMNYQKDAPPETMLPEVMIALPTVESDDTKAHGLGYMSAGRWKVTYDTGLSTWGIAPGAIGADALWSDAYMPEVPVKADCSGKQPG